MRDYGIDAMTSAVARRRTLLCGSAALTQKHYAFAVGSHPKQKADPLRAKGPFVAQSQGGAIASRLH